MNTNGLRGVCVRIVPRVDPSVCSQHGVKYLVAADHPMIWRRKECNVRRMNFVMLKFVFPPYLFNVKGNIY